MAFLRRLPRSQFWIGQFWKKNDDESKTLVTRSTKVPVDPKSKHNVHGRSAAELYDEAMERVKGWERVANGNLTEAQTRKVIVELARKFSHTQIKIPSVMSWFEERIRAYGRDGLSEAGVRNYYDARRCLLEFLGKERFEGKLDRVTRIDAEGFKGWLLERYRVTTSNSMLSLVKRVFKDAKQLTVLEDNPFEAVRQAKAGRKPQEAVVRRAFTVDELKVLLEACDEEWRSMVLVSLYTGGQRLGDVACLRWDAVSFERRLVSFVTQKTGRAMVVPMVRPLLELLQARRSVVAGEFVHPVAAEDYMRRRSNYLSRVFGHLLFTCGLVERDLLAAGRKRRKGENGEREVSRKRSRNELSFHSLRSSATTMLHNAGVPAALVQDIVGHSSQAVHEGYIKFGETAVRDALGRLPEL